MILDDGTVAIDVTDGPGKLPKVESWLKFPRKYDLLVSKVFLLQMYYQQVK